MSSGQKRKASTALVGADGGDFSLADLPSVEGGVGPVQSTVAPVQPAFPPPAEGGVALIQPTGDVDERLWVHTQRGPDPVLLTLSDVELRHRWGCQQHQVAGLRRMLEAGLQTRQLQQPGRCQQFTQASIESFLRELRPIAALYDDTTRRLNAVVGRSNETPSPADQARFGRRRDLVETVLVLNYETLNRAKSHSSRMASAVSIGGLCVSEGFVAEGNNPH
jgi:hypothetical protein